MLGKEEKRKLRNKEAELFDWAISIVSKEMPIYQLCLAFNAVLPEAQTGLQALAVCG